MITGSEKLNVNFDIATLTETESMDQLKRTQVRGVRIGGEPLTTDRLKKAGLFPKYKVEIDNLTIYFSDIYLHAGIRPALISYIENSQKELIAHTYYLSRSQGTWRYVPGFRSNEDNRVTQISKGFSEESVTLPFVLQKVLSDLLSRDHILDLKYNIDPDTALAGTTIEDYSDRNNPYYMEVAHIPRYLPGSQLDNKQTKRKPSEILIGNDSKPNFANTITTWTQETDLYGEVNYYVFPSFDGNVYFTFCRDKLGRAWIGNVDATIDLTSLGLNKNWYKHSDLTTPAYEYCQTWADYTGGYGNRGLTKFPYVDMYENYLSKIPIIQEFQYHMKGNS